VKTSEYFRTDNISLETSFHWLSEDIVRFKIEVGVEEKCTKMLTPFPVDFPHTPQHAVHGSMTLLSLAGVYTVYCSRTLLGRRICKRVDVYMITLSCTWRIYALSERLLFFSSSIEWFSSYASEQTDKQTHYSSQYFAPLPEAK